MIKRQRIPGRTTSAPTQPVSTVPAKRPTSNVQILVIHLLQEIVNGQMHKFDHMPRDVEEHIHEMEQFPQQKNLQQGFVARQVSM